MTWSEKADLLRAAGRAAPTAPPAGGFTLTARAPYAENQGWAVFENVLVDPARNLVLLDDVRGSVGVWSAGSPTAKQDLVHFQVLLDADAHGGVTLYFMASLERSAAPPVFVTGDGVHDVSVLVTLPNGEPVPGPFPLVWINGASSGLWRILGVEVTPM